MPQRDASPRCRTARYEKCGDLWERVRQAPATNSDHNVGRVLVEVLAAVVVHGCRSGIGMTGGDLDIAKWNPGVEGAHDEGGSEHMRVHVAEAGTSRDRPHPAVRRPPVEALAVVA